MIFDLGGGKQIVATNDNGRIHLQLWSNRGSLGSDLPPHISRELGLWLFQAGRKLNASSGNGS